MMPSWKHQPDLKTPSVISCRRGSQDNKNLDGRKILVDLSPHKHWHKLKMTEYKLPYNHVQPGRSGKVA